MKQRRISVAMPALKTPPELPRKETTGEYRVRNFRKALDSTWVVVVAFLVVGPLALPLLWRNPKFSITTKIIGSAVMIGLTLALIYVFKEIAQTMVDTLNSGVE